MMLLPLLAWSQSGQLVDSAYQAHWEDLWHGEQRIPCLWMSPRGYEPTRTVVLLHDFTGLTVELRQVAASLSAVGYQVLIPDWLATAGVALEIASDQSRSMADLEQTLGAIPMAEWVACMESIMAHLDSMPEAAGAVLVMGLGWGGTRAFELATRTHKVSATLVVGGHGPQLAAHCARISAPVYGFYGGSDPALMHQISSLGRYMLASGKTFEPIIYPEAEPGFLLRRPAQQTQGSQEARKQAMARIVSLLARY
jgi:dienelactone hydrolase